LQKSAPQFLKQDTLRLEVATPTQAVKRLS